MSQWFQYDRRIFKYFNYLLVIQIIPLLAISSYLINEINPLLFKKQMLYYGIGAIAFLVTTFIPWRKLIWWFAPLFYTMNLLLLLAVDLVGKTILGAQRWIEIPGTGLTLQPSE
ncbi:MAG TPA: rod shape-determining protein RodA, partial [Epsilonproteobacteria bacterium]|nr:rod shape-determining protein RodA [Campylobacterota bacterium]